MKIMDIYILCLRKRTNNKGSWANRRKTSKECIFNYGKRKKILALVIGTATFGIYNTKSFLKVCEEAKAKTEIVYFKKKHINHCNGCFSCWTKTPGKCIHKDDIEELLGIMKYFMDCMLPLNNREIIKVDEKYGYVKEETQAVYW